MKKVKPNKLTRRILSIVLTVVLVVGLMPGNMLTVSAEGIEAGKSEEIVVETVSSNAASATTECTCGTDDPAFHATNCPAYIAPENPQCYCAEKCTEDTLNVWCDVCGMQGVSACQGEDIAVTYAATEPYDGVPVTPQKITSSNYRTFGLTESNWEQYNGYYAIRNSKELYGFAEIINGLQSTEYKKAVLLNDIVVNETVSESGATYSWTPIGGDVYFSGEFDGNGHSISGLYCNTPDESKAGLFGRAGVAIIRNVTLENSYLCGNTRVGGIVGHLSSATLTNCKVDSDVTIVATSSDEAVNVGGMFGRADTVSVQHGMCNFTNCTSLATVKALNVHKRESGYYAANMGAFCGYASYELCEQTAGTNCFYVSNSVTGADGASDRGAGGDDVINGRLATITIDNNGEITDTHTHVSATHSRIEPTCYSTGLTEYSYCIICGEITSGTKTVLPTIPHEYSDATCTVPATCVYCGVTTGGTIDHSYSDATCTTPPTCTVCGYQEGELNSDNHETVETHYEVSESNRRMHDKVYNCCGAIILSESHTISNGSCTVCGWVCQHLSVSNGKCDDCGLEGDTSYVNRYWDPVNKKVITNDYALVGNVTEITSLTTTLSEGWYIVKGEVTNANRLTVSGEVNIILADGCTLNVSSGINVPSGTTLNIYGQQHGTGTLTAGTNDRDNPAIGGELGGCGTITINGGKVNVNVAARAAAIGSAKQNATANISDGGSVVINGGEISVSKSNYGAAIGSGSGNNGCSVTINGGKVNATHSGSYGAAIGSGGINTSGGSCSVVIRGGTVTANNLDNSSGAGDGIGKGRGSTCTVTIEGGNIRATKTYSSSVEVRDPKNASDTSVSLVEITLYGAADGTDVTELEGITYGIYDVKTIGDKLYLYLPADTMPTSVTAGGKCYDCYKDGIFYQHSWVDATCFSPKHCSRCEITEGEASSHNYENGVCTYCGKDENGVFHIETAEQLVAFAQYVELGNKDADAVLDADIDMTGVAWTPICQTVSFHETAATDTGYTGTFDGNGYTISNLTVTGISGGTYSYGLFGTVSGTVENLGMVNYTYTMGSAPDARAGSIAGQVISGGTITNCYSVGHTVTTNDKIAGGIAGCNYGGTISNCYALNGSVSGYSTRWGGVVGDCNKDNTAPDLAQTYGTVSNCYTDNTRVASTQNNSANITNCAVKDDDAFASGEITYLLNGSSSGNVTWYQRLGTDTYPVLDREHGKVYSVFKCDEETQVYRNVNENEPHTDINPVDSVCDECGANLHTHEWTYTANDDTITAVCGADDCPLNGAAKTIVISASDKTYDGTAVVATVENNVDTTDYSSSIVYKDNEGAVVDEAVNAGTYTANLTVGGVTASVEFTIAKVTPDIGTVSASNMANTLDVSQVVLSRSNGTVPGTLSLAEGTTLQYGIHDYTYVFTPNDNTNYETVTGTVSITISDTISPTATYKVGTDEWKQFINTITFGHFCKDYTTVDITYSDEGSGVADKQYYISDVEITNTENIQWSEYTDTLNINATGKYYIYVRVTDNYGNVVIQNSEGIVVYAESVITPTSFSCEYGEENDLYVNISANGNTFANLTDGSGNEIATENYSIDASTLTIKGEYLSDLDVGEYTYKICMNPQGVETTEVTLAYSFVVNVTAKELTVTGATAASRDYIANDKTVDITGVTLSGIQGTDDVSVKITGLKGTLSSANAGTYTSVTLPTLTLTGDDAENYEIVQPTSAVATDVTINKLNPTITVGETEYYKTFGDADFTLDITDDNPEANVTCSSNDENVVTVSNGTVTIKGAGSTTITVSMGASTNYNAAVDKIITVNVVKATYSVDTINKNYLYAISNADSINLAELLPEDCGTVNYASVTSDGALRFISEPNVTNGILAYTLESGAADDTGIIVVDVETQNYKDITITVNVTLIDQIPVNVDGEVELNSNVLTYGETLSGLTFKSVAFVDNAGNEVEGTLAWKEPSATPNAGTTSATWVFTPNNAEYASVEGTVVITVNKATPNVTGVPTVADRVYNPSVVLADSDLTGGTVKGVDGNSLAGSWSWQSKNVVPVVNNSGYIAVFTPTDSRNYETVTRTITVNVTKATPYVATKPTASALAYGQTLNQSVLSNGVIHYSETDSTVVAGSFAWEAGTVKPVVADSNVTQYDVVFTPTDAENYNKVETKITLTVNKAETTPNMPESTMSALYSQKTVGALDLPEGWVWNEADSAKELTVNVAVEATAIYNGADKGNYEMESVTISITRQACDHEESDILYTGEGEKAPTCTEAGIGHTECTKCKEPMQTNVTVEASGHTGGTATCKNKAECSVCHEGYGELDKNNHAGETEVKDAKKATCGEEGYTGDTYCKDCGAKIATGTKIDKSTAHTWDEGVVTKEATATEKGEKTYTCSVCKTTKKEEIPALGAPKVGEEIASEDGSATYKVTEAGENGNSVTYEAPTDKNQATVVVPATVTINNITYNVTTISDTAFAGNKKLTSVTIGDNVTGFSAKTFKGCSNLKTLIIGNGVTSIPANAFKNFKQLTTVKMGTGVKTIGKNAFYGCKKLKNLTLGKNVVTIGDKVFYKCTSLTKLTIPSKVKTIGKSAFYGCKALKTITIGKSVAKIGSKAFYGCSKTKTLTIKSSKLTTKKIGSKAFTKTPKSMTVKVPKKKFKAYKSMFIKRGVNKKAKFRKS